MAVFYMRLKHVYPKFNIIDEEIEVVDEFKFLCIIINKHIKWMSHR